MRIRSMLVGILLLLGVLTATLVVLPDNVKAVTRYVGGGGPGNYSTIQLAVNAANPGDTIHVYGGTYVENVVVSKALSLVGEDKQTTIIDGGFSDSVVTVTSNWVNISGFTVMNSGPLVGNAGVSLDSVHYCTVTDIIATDNDEGIFLYSSGENTISLVEARSNFVAGVLLIFSSTNIIETNDLHSNFNDGIVLDRSSSNTVRWNNIWDNDDGIILSSDFDDRITSNVIWNNYWGIRLTDSENAIITDNNISSSTRQGIRIQDSTTATLTGNMMNRSGIHIEGDAVTFWNTHTIDDTNTVNGKPVHYRKDAAGGTVPSGAGQVILANCIDVVVEDQDIDNGTTGILLGFSSTNTIAGNTLSYNKNGLYLTSSSGNEIYHNSFIFNAPQGWDGPENNFWDDGYPSGGNYWSGYAGADQYSGPDQDQPGSDGIGDDPRPLDASDEDRYPLMSPYVSSIPPEPPILLQADLSGLQSESVMLTWSLSPDDGAGLNSVAGYEIRRSVTYDLQGLGYGLLVTLPNQTAAYVDVLAGEGDPNDYFYLVCAFDGYGKASCSDNQASKFTRQLSKGPNLVSIPLLVSDESTSTVLRTMSFDSAWFFDPVNENWECYGTFKDYRRSLSHIDRTMGFWVTVTDGSNLTVAGIVPSSTNIQLRSGWNLVSFPSFNVTYTVADLKAETGATRVEGYDPSPPYHLRVLGDGEMLQAGYGYWVKVETDSLWIVEVS
ncbi:MAG: right-handed parallel beta-helix repeat-containing protein [Candidatus Thermoplasmatota archaeon]|nr:right-handed parallel beta-helix repeat-containing protein [Candidatus Thermoplasmatota archaeon]